MKVTDLEDQVLKQDPTTRARLVEVLLRSLEQIEAHPGARAEADVGRAAKQRRYLEQLSLRVDVAVLASEEMWR